MRKSLTSKIIIICITVVMTISAVIAIHFSVKPLETVPTHKIDGQLNTDKFTEDGGESVTAISVIDLQGLKSISSVNFTPSKYLIPRVEVGGKEMYFEKNSPDKFSVNGTYQFIFVNLDPWDESFKEKSDLLSPYLKGDNYWHFTLYLPPILGACNVYISDVLIERVGEISNYKISDYCDYQETTKVHKNMTEPLFIDLKFNSKRENIPVGNPLWGAQIVTIHFEGGNNSVNGLTGLPIVGDNQSVSNFIARDQISITFLLIVSSLMLAIFLFLCFLKRSLSYLPQLLISIAVFGALLAAYLWNTRINIPYIIFSFAQSSLSLILFTSAIGNRIKIKRFPVWIPAAVFVAVTTVLSFAIPLTFSALSYQLSLVLKILIVISACFVCLLTVTRALTKGEVSLSINPLIAVIAAISSVFLPSTSLGFLNPIFWLLTAMLAVTACISIGVFMNMEKRDRYLTANLQSEVMQQTDSLQKIVGERDKLIMFISHDLKKPIISAGEILSNIRTKTFEPEILKGIDSAIKKNKEISDVLNEVSAFSKTNFSAEKNVIFDLFEILNKVCETLSPDCLADGVVLDCKKSNINVFGKPFILSSVIYNLILNALDHAECKNISITTRKKKNLCVIEVIDDGKGIPKDKDIFAPYVSENYGEENQGLGLYLARASIEAMGGLLYYAERQGNTVFTVTLPLA